MTCSPFFGNPPTFLSFTLLRADSLLVIVMLYSLLTIENESAESAIRVVRQYVHWRSPSQKTVPDNLSVNELATSRSVRMFAVDTSGQPAQTTKPDRFRRPEPIPYFNILVATDGMVSLYRVLCQRSVQDEILSVSPREDGSTPDEGPEDSTFTWVFSLKAQATHIGLCDSYLSYTTTAEAFLMHFYVDQVSLEDHSLSRICHTSIDTVDTDRPKMQHHSTVLSSTSLLRVKEASGSRKSGSATPSSLSRSSSFASMGSSSPALGAAAAFTGSAGEPKGMAGRAGGSASAAGRSVESTPSENSQHHFDIVFDRNNAVKDRAPYVELSLDKLSPQVIGPQGTSLGAAMIPANGTSSNLGEIVGPHHDVHSYVVNTDDDFQLNSSQLLFYRNFKIAKTTVDADFLVLSGSLPIAEAESVSLNSLSLSPIHRTPDAPGSPPMPSSPFSSLVSSSNETTNKSKDPNVTEIQGVKLFVGCAQKGHLWMFKKLDLCESVTYDWPSECHHTIVTSNFVYALTEDDTVLIAQMRQFDPLHSGNKFGVMSGEGVRTSKPQKRDSSTKPRASIGPESQVEEVVETRCKTLVQQKSQPPLVGALGYFGITRICVGSDGKMMILCKSTVDDVRARRDSSLASTLKQSNAQRSRSGSSGQNSNANSADSPSLQRRNVADGWNIVTTVFNSPQSMMDQFKTWTTPATLSKDDWDMLVEFWTFTIAVSKSFLAPDNPLELSRWASAEDHKRAVKERMSIFTALGQLEFDAKRLTRAAVMWSLSDLPVDQATQKLMQRLKDGKVGSMADIAQAACEELLKRVLLGPTQRMDLIEAGSKGFADVVYAILVHQNAPLVGQVVLESPLSNFELDATIVLLEQTMNNLERKSLSGVDMAQNFLANAVVLNLDGEVETKSPLNDFWVGQTQEDKELWMTTLALVVLMLKRDESEESLVARRNGSFKGSLSLSTPDAYLFKLPGAFLVPYLTTHSHLMFDSAPASSPAAPLPDADGSMDAQPSNAHSTAAESSALVPSRLAHLLAQTLPWVCLETLAVGGVSIFPTDYSTHLLSGKGYNFSWAPVPPASATMDSSAPSSAPSSVKRIESLISSSLEIQKSISEEKNPALITTYYEALLLSTLNPAPKNGVGVLASSSHPAPTLNTFGSSPLKRTLGPTSTTSASALPDISVVEALASRYIALAHLSADEVTQLLAYTTSDWINRMNPHNTNPPLSLEGIWKEFHHEYLLESRYKFIAGVLPVHPPPKGTLATQGIPEWFYVIKLHGLLCALTTLSMTFPAFSSPLKHIANHVMREAKNAALPDRVVDSIVLLCQPILGDFEDTVLQLTLLHPTSLIKFLKRYLPMGDLSKWKVTLQVLLAQIAKAETKEAVWCLQETLTYMARNLPSLDFLNLLPDNGNVAFFIPYIELNLGRNASMNLLTEIQAVK